MGIGALPGGMVRRSNSEGGERSDKPESEKRKCGREEGRKQTKRCSSERCLLDLTSTSWVGERAGEWRCGGATAPR